MRAGFKEGAELVIKHFCDICGKELERPVDIITVVISSLVDEVGKFELCLDCLAHSTIPELVSNLIFSGDDPRKFNFSKFEGRQQITVYYEDIKSLLKKKYGDFDDPFWGYSEEDVNRTKEALRKLQT